MENLPGDILSNIFIRLLAKQLAQMRCVCKHWNTLLSEPLFIKCHLDRSIHKNEKILLFFKKGVSFDTSPGPLTARSSSSPHLELTNYIKLKLPINPQYTLDRSYVIGSVNGLICFCYILKDHSGAICIWNPSLSAVLTLPPFSVRPESSYFGFGFDPKTNDYKVIKLPCYSEIPDMVTQPHGGVYSMRKGSWEIISQRVPSHIKDLFFQNEGCLHGHLHWLCVADKVWERIVRFDLSAETFHEIPLPDCITYDAWRDKTTLGVLDGKLCVISCNITDGDCEVWVMNDDESWLKHHIFSQFDYRITPYGFTSHNEFLFRVDRDCRFALYDPTAAKTKIFKINMERELDYRFRIIEYVDSLVWMAPANQLQI